MTKTFWQNKVATEILVKSGSIVGCVFMKKPYAKKHFFNINMLSSPHFLSTVLAQDHFYSDFLSLHVTT